MKHILILGIDPHAPLAEPQYVPDDEYFDWIKEQLGDPSMLLQIVPTPDGDLYVDEEGLLKQLPLNMTASMLVDQTIVGPVAWVKNVPQGADINV